MQTLYRNENENLAVIASDIIKEIYTLYLNNIQLQCSCFCGRLSEEETRDVEIIVETEAVVDDMNYAECDLESGKLILT